MKKKFLSIVLAVILIFSFCSSTVQAMTDEPLLDLPREELFISEDIAHCIAELFLQDIKQLDGSVWNDNTKIISTFL